MPGTYHADYAVGGKSVFVRITCDYFSALPAIFQEEAYNQAVKLSQVDLAKTILSWAEFTCDLWGKNKKDGQAIYLEGKGFPRVQLGADGEVLQDGIKGRCGLPDPSKWSFKWGTNDGYEWSVNVPVSDKNSGLEAAWQCVLDYFGAMGAPQKNQAKDCKLHT